jgi:hypothetical protein
MKNNWFIGFNVLFVFVIISCDNGTTNNSNGQGTINVTFQEQKIEEFQPSSFQNYGKRVYYRLSWTSVPGADYYAIYVNRGSDLINNWSIVARDEKLTSTYYDGDGHLVEDVDTRNSYYADPYVCTYKVWTITDHGLVEGSIKVTYKITKDAYGNITKFEILK